MLFREDVILYFDMYTNFPHVMQSKYHGNNITLK